MFTINGNHKEFTQWQQGYSLLNPNMNKGDAVCFFSGAGDGSVMYAKEENGVVLVEVPNIMLKHAANITVRFKNGGDYTLFKVIKSEKPKNYEFIDNEKVEKENLTNGAGVSSWNNLTDKPFGVESRDPIVWDGNTEGRDMTLDGRIFKVSDEAFTKEEVIGAILTIKIHNKLSGIDEVQEILLTSDNVMPAAEGLILTQERINVDTTFPFISTSVDGNVGGVEIPSTGTYFTYKEDGSVRYYVSSLTFPEQVKPLDEKYMPTLTSPNGTKFKLSVDDDGNVTATGL